ncbi:DUF3413 domain-containing protein [Shewanella intestini]|uniref:DUF3413 domain-containing protein n=1 Tax=Shewanella intestini TaxID=2017544 RepID=A0ABS5I5I3_9GAMM|nr:MULTISPECIES: DUF3413 domain-containing protein [Shewanella]MBR9728969.1 DUF3413 domain-containing protein [Shewanella intestini]MRG36965.1 DUF3413 domain-containing protein [Shewanella sp. XMDDZSB0408]
MAERKKQMSRDKISRLVNWGHWFAFFNGFLAMLIGVRYIRSVGGPDSIIEWVYISISTIGHFTFLAFIVYLVFIFPITLLLPYSKILRGYTAVVASIGLYALLFDTLIYDDYGIHLSPFAFDLAWQDLGTLLHSTSYISVPIAILVLELTAANFLWKRIEKLQKKQWGNKVVVFVGICFFSSHLLHIWADAANVNDIIRFDDVYPVSYPATAKSFMANHGINSNEEDTVGVTRSHTNSQLAYPIKPLQCDVDTQPNNVLMVVIDSLRADMVTPKTMPFLSQYQNNNTHFTDHYTGGTQYQTSLFSLLYGLQSSYIDRADFNHTEPVLTSLLREKNYQNHMFTSSENQQLLLGSGMLNGFSVSALSTQNGSAETDILINKSFSQWHKQQTQPWFALVNFSAPRDFDTPVGFLGIETVQPPVRLKPAQKVLFNQYRQSLYFIDQQLKQLLSQVSTQTTVVITGTHGQVFSSDTYVVRRDFSPANVKVPLIIHEDGLAKKKITYRTSHYGVVPTLLSHTFNCSNPLTDYSSGRTLFQPNDEQWVYIGNSRVFAIYQASEATVLDRHGNYQIYNLAFDTKLKKKISAPELIQVMREGRRLYNN